MSGAKRIQLSRKKGWRKPEGAVVVARPWRFGNPYRVDAPHPVHGWPMSRQEAVDLYERDLLAEKLMSPSGHQVTTEDARQLLAGKDLACFCPLDQPCHADVLLRIANGPTP